MKNLVFAALVIAGSAVVFGFIRHQQNKRAEAAFEREAERQAKEMPAIRKQHAEQERQRQQQFMQAENCAQQRRNLKVLEEASAKGLKVVEHTPGGQAVPVATRDIPGAIYDTQGYLAKNC